MATTAIDGTVLPTLTSCGHQFDTSAASFGELRSSIDVIDDAVALKQRIEEDGYLFLPGYLDRDLALEAHTVITDRLEQQDALEPGTDPMDAEREKASTSSSGPTWPRTTSRSAGRKGVTQPPHLRDGGVASRAGRRGDRWGRSGRQPPSQGLLRPSGIPADSYAMSEDLARQRQLSTLPPLALRSCAPVDGSEPEPEHLE